MRVAKGTPPPEPPGHIATLIQTLEKSGFQTIYKDEVAQGFGDFMQVLERPPVRIRVVRDRGQWSAQLTADGWPRDLRWGEPWVLLPPTVGNRTEPQ
jgi:hypothetical protein